MSSYLSHFFENDVTCYHAGCVSILLFAGKGVRITGGQARGRAILAPSGLEVRPTASKIRQAFFNILGKRVLDARFLDLCAGSGLMGMEALSRGAGELIAVEESRKFAKAIEDNLKHLKLLNAEVICGDVRKALPILSRHGADIIFADPPYKAGLLPTILSLIDQHELLHPQGIIAVEHAIGTQLPDDLPSLVNVDYRKYGQTGISFFAYRADVEPS